MDGVIEKRIVIHTKPETVYRTLTEARFLAKWLADKAEARPVPGGALLLYSGVGESAKGVEAVYTDLVPNRSVRFRWSARISSGERTTERGVHENVFVIDRSPDGVIVTMRDEEMPAPTDSERMKTEQGWDQVLGALKTLCEGPESPDRVPDVTESATVVVAPARVKAPGKQAKAKRPAKRKAGAKKARPAARRASGGKKKSARKTAKKKSAKRKAKPASGRRARKAPAKRAKAKRPAKQKAARKSAKAARRRK